MSDVILAIDAGTTGVRIFALDREGRSVASAYSEFTQHYPRPGWVEHDAGEIWSVTRRLLGEILGKVASRGIAGIGITNQRETTVIWDRKTQEPLARAIVWQCRRTEGMCRGLQAAGHDRLFRERTGLVLDAYFSGTKAKWLLDSGLRAQARKGEALFGTIDTWLAFKLSGGAIHVTDFTNASRTLMFDIHERAWDDDLLEILDVPRACLPDVRSSSEVYGNTAPEVTAGLSIPIAGMAGDQQAALFGQGAWRRGEMKNTYGTGCFALLNLGARPVESRNGLILTLACDARGKPAYALEGSVFIAGAVVQWLRDGLGIIERAEETDALARSVESTGGVYVVPAFVGLGAPYWDMGARGMVAGITRGTTRAHIVRAALESIAYQTRDLVGALEADLGDAIPSIRVDGGATANPFLMQFQADILGKPIERPQNRETTVLGAAYLAGLATGFWDSPDRMKALNRTEETYAPAMDAAERERLYAGWKEAVERARSRGERPA